MSTTTTEAVVHVTTGPDPPVWHRMYDRFVDTGSPRSMSSSFRARRWHLLLGRFAHLDAMTVLDLGGTVAGWSVAPVLPAHLTIVNCEPAAGPVPGGVEVVLGDACSLDRSITERSWDLVFANSVIEHVGGHARRLAFAESVRTLAPHHWVQTPNRWFPLEPHFLVPGLQFLPTRLRAQVIADWPLNKWRPADRRAAMEAALELELIGRAELAHYFPTSRIVSERIGPLTKSLVAVA
jgi:hypothetical protein